MNSVPSHPPLPHGPIVTTGPDSDHALRVAVDLAHHFHLPRLRAIELSNKYTFAINMGRRWGVDSLVLAALIVCVERIPVHIVVHQPQEGKQEGGVS
jgi:hypothetical protein